MVFGKRGETIIKICIPGAEGNASGIIYKFVTRCLSLKMQNVFIIRKNLRKSITMNDNYKFFLYML